MKLTVVIPVCNEEATLAALVEGIATHLADHDYRICFVDDGSTDGSHEELLRLQSLHARIDLITFAHNCGKTLALAVAFAQAEGDVVATMDADLQDDPKELPRLLAKLEEGYDLVCGWKAKRHDPLHKTFPSRIYNRVINWGFGLDIHDVNTGYKVMRMSVAKSLPLYADMHRLIPIMATQAGYTVTEIPVTHHRRRFGHSKYGMARFYQGIRDACRLRFRDKAVHTAAAAAALEQAQKYVVDR